MGQILPFYLVCDESGSMSGKPLDAINDSLPKIHSEIASIPALTVKGGTNYSSAFDLLYDTIAEDVKQLKASGDQVYRPAVFFLSDGQPGDNWEGSYKRLIDPSWTYHPNILAFGFGDVDARTL